MKSKIYSLILACATLPLFSQVGINTDAPTATLDVNGTLRVRVTPPAATVTGYQILAQDAATTEVYTLDPQLLIAASNVNSSIYSAKKTATLSLLSLGLFPSGFRSVNFLQAERTIGTAALFSDTDNTYTIPTTGVYAITFSFRLGTGLQASVLANSPGVGILRTRSSVATVIDSRPFSGANLVLLDLTISDTTINGIYSLQAGDKITFGLTGSSAITAGLLTNSISSFYIYKVSN